MSIASYRDRLLADTVRDCLQKAHDPGRLRFGICWQHGSDEELPEWFRGEQFKVLDVDYRESRGACWARAMIQELWDGEEWFLQLDSHHRFAPDWDELLHDEAGRTGTDRFVLTSSAPPFAATKQETLTQLPITLQFKEFSDGVLLHKPEFIADWEQRTRPHRARYLSAHLLFAPGRFIRDVPYDPDLYFDGEEITLAVRAFTHGYDLFEPSKAILWHEVTYAYQRRRHWDDHVGDAGPAWWERDVASKARIRQLFGGGDLGRFGLGTERTLEQYEAYAGVSFRHQKVQDYTRQNREPPNPPAARDWFREVKDHHVEITVDVSQLHANATDDDVFWHIDVHDSQGNALYVRQVPVAELAEQLAGGGMITLSAQFESQADPATWRVVPHSKTDGWLTWLTGTVDSSEWVDLHARRPARVPQITWETKGDRHVASLPGTAPRRRELNSSGALLVELADGRHSIRDIATYLRRAHQLVDDPVTEIADFYDRARSAGLVTIGKQDAEPQ